LNPIYTVYARAIERVLETAGYSLIVEESKADLEGEKQAVRKLLSSQVDGLLCFFMDYKAHYDTIMANRPKGLSLVFFGESYPDSGIDSIMIDFSRGTIEAVNELVDLGHKRIGLLHGYHPGPGTGTDTRLEFFRSEMEKRDIPFSNENIIVSGPTIEEAYDQFKEYLDKTDPEDRATAVFAINDIIALGVMRAAKDCGLNLPEDLSIIGVDNTPLSRFLPVSLTTVSYPIKDISKTATDFLLARMKGDDEPQREVMFSSRLVRRESTAPAPE
jgi:DNA-binding LacI/PurR family transcriptional regulator